VVAYVSIVNRYKHQWHVVEAVAKLRAQSQMPIKLVLAGPAERSSLHRLETSIRRYDPDRNWVDYRGPVPHSELPALYDAADIGVFASSCETFGIILLENLGMGLPVACSNRSSLPEVARDAVIYFDPEEPASLADALARFAKSAEMRAEFSRRAVERAAYFDWRSVASDTIDFIMASADEVA
jgi:glycosyltransferase involved in cell wall biosynthesis